MTPNARSEPAHHPLVAEVLRRPQWRPRPFTRALTRVSRGTREVVRSTNILEREWHLIAAAALRSGLPLWVVLGDSISQGVGATSLARTWVARIAGALEADGRAVGVVNVSRSGARGHHVRTDQLDLIGHLEQRPVLVTCAVGSNDMMRNPLPHSVAARVTAVVEELPEASVVSTLPTPAKSPAGRHVNRALRRAARTGGHRVADVVPHLVSPRHGLARDLFHPSDRGYQAWVDAYCEALDLDPARVPDEWEPPRA